MSDEQEESHRQKSKIRLHSVILFGLLLSGLACPGKAEDVEKALKSRTGRELAVVVELTDDVTCVANGEIAVAFQRKGNQLSVRSLFDVASRREFVKEVEGTNALWQLTFRPPDFAADKAVSIDAAIRNCDWRTEKTSAGINLHLVWRGLDLVDEPKAVDVEATVLVPNKGALTEWRIKVANRSKRWGLWSANFPRVANLTVSRDGALAVPMGWGQLYKDATRTGSYQGDYPNGWATMQFASLFDGGRGVYLAAHDGQAIHKCIVFVPHPEIETVAFEIVQYPPSMASPGKTYESPYPVIVGTHSGDWYDAAKIYRAWAMKNSIWFPRLPLSRNRDTPEWLKQNPLWICTGGNPKGGTESCRDILPEVTKFKEFFGVPMGFHWYFWEQNPMDDHYPEYFPAKEGFKETVAQLKAIGVHVMPYINGRLFDSRANSWKNESAQNFCALSEKGERYGEVYCGPSSPPLSPMCPATPYWQDKIAGIAERLVGEFGANGVYLDQIGAASVAPCFNRHHAHGAGGAAAWVPGYRELLTRAKTKMKAKDPESFLTTEDAAEPYMGKIDAFLMCNQTRGGLIPMFPAVYGGRTLTFGRVIQEDDIKGSLPFITKVAEMFIFGAQLGWIRPFILNYPKEAGYLKRLAETRLMATKYLALGEMLRPPIIESDEPPFKTTWIRGDGGDGKQEVEFPAVMGSVWRADDGTVALVVVNLTDQTLKVRWRCEEKSGEADIRGLSAKIVEVR